MSDIGEAIYPILANALLNAKIEDLEYRGRSVASQIAGQPYRYHLVFDFNDSDEGWQAEIFVIRLNGKYLIEGGFFYRRVEVDECDLGKYPWAKVIVDKTKAVIAMDNAQQVNLL